MKKTTRILAMVLALALVISIAPQNAYAGAGVGSSLDGNEYTIEQAALQLVTDKAAGKYKLISSESLKKLVDKKSDVVIVDTMPSGFDEQYKIPGALNAEVGLTSEEFDATQKKALLKVVKKACTVTKKVKKNGKTTTKTVVDKTKKVIVYCGFVKCRRSHWAAQYLVKQGYTNVYRYAGGISAWIDAKYDIEGTKAEETNASYTAAN